MKQNDMESKVKWFWVVGSYSSGYRIVSVRPKNKIVREPHRTKEDAQRWVDLEYLLNA